MAVQRNAKKWVEPVAQAWMQMVGADTAEEKFEGLCESTGVILRLLVASAAAAAWNEGAGGCPAELERAVQDPSIGKLAAALEAWRPHAASQPSPFLPEWSRWQEELRDGQTPLSLIRRMANEWSELQQPDVDLEADEATERMNRWEIDLHELMSSVDWLSHYGLYQVVEARDLGDGTWSGALRSFDGRFRGGRLYDAHWRGTLATGETWLVAEDGSRALCLSPLIQVAEQDTGLRLALLENAILPAANSPLGERIRLAGFEVGGEPDETGTRVVSQAEPGAHPTRAPSPAKVADPKRAGATTTQKVALAAGVLAVLALLWKLLAG